MPPPSRRLQNVKKKKKRGGRVAREYGEAVVVPKSISRVTSPQYAYTDRFRRKKR